jgi:hypothetical protein
MLIAEGSDWFWWYGDDHSSAHDLAFDDLFRRHVRNIYRLLERPIPEELFVSNITTAPPAVEIQAPTGFIQPEIDGEATSYFEWVGAGCVEAPAAAGAMHQVSGQQAGIAAVEFGFDLEHLYVRVDGTVPIRQLLARGAELSISFLNPPAVRGELRTGDGSRATMRLVERTARGEWKPRDDNGVAAAVGHVAEFRIPFRALGVRTHESVAFFVSISRDGGEAEHHPRHRPIEVTVPDRSFGALNWTA